jgi:hypothetical protein
MTHIILDLNDYFDLWLSTQSIHHIYLKNMEVHLLMINYEKLLCAIFYFCINKLPQVDALARAMHCFPLRGLYPRKNTGVLIFDLVV